MKKSMILSFMLVFTMSLFLPACAGRELENSAPLNTDQAVSSGLNNEAQPEEVPAQNPEAETMPTLTLTDGRGLEISLIGPAQRVISLAPSNTELLYAAGAADQVVAREDFSNYPPEALELPSVGGGYSELNMELILSLEPDLILIAELTSPEQIQALEELGLTVFQISNPVELSEMFENLRVVAQLTGHSAEVEEKIRTMQARVDSVLSRIAAANTQPVVFYELDSTDPSAPWTSGPGTFIDTLITLAGGVNLGAAYEGAWVSISAEALLAEDPDIIILGDSIWGVTPESVAARPGWESLSAVENELVFAFNDDLASRPGPRLVDGLEELARLIHPEVFE